ncbi:MAG: lysylphosphatidylglycerol synthase domain-containing protein [Acetobacteraceae bacterium]|nr:lysylphosphatidylglycerol synthase domain-containing protein [Acetobacteraceae bacterium]
MRRVSILLALLGVAAAAALFVHFNAAEVAGAVLSIGWGGAALLLAIQGGLFCLLGLAWAVVQPGIRPRLLIWGRMVRDAATTCLPFSPVGGYVIGIRAVTLRGPTWTQAAGGTVVDVTAEITAQLLFSLFGVGVLLLARPGSDLIVPVGAGASAALVGLGVAVWQRARIGRVLGGLAAKLVGATAVQAATLGQQAQLLYAGHARLSGAVFLHFAGWMVTGVATWLGLRLLGLAPELVSVLALEALIDAVIAVAFVAPGAVGVQEAGYVGLGAVFGIPPDLALGVSLLRRGREVIWGLPILAIWQWQEVRRL